MAAWTDTKHAFYLKFTLPPWFTLGTVMEWTGIPRHPCAIIKAHPGQESKERARLRHSWQNDATEGTSGSFSQTRPLTAARARPRVVFPSCLSGCCNRSPKTGRLKQEPWVSHSSGGWEVQDGGAGGSGSRWEPSSWLAVAPSCGALL